ncbi:MAG TPA: cellulose synthase, partial [Aggregicoccus sp.]|nr:cellulose synthase [Aggregicoccus sp.]
GELLEGMNAQEQALAAFDRAIAARGVLHPRAVAAKGALLVRRHEYEPARALLAPLAPADGSGKVAEAYQAMSELHFAQGDFSAGCQHAFYALARMEDGGGGRLHGYVKAVNQRLLDAGKAQLSRAWMSETQTLVSER